jgi:hypothetical protein
MNEPIVVSPTADPGQPGLKPLEFGIAEVGGQIFQEKYSESLLFQDLTREQTVCDLQDEA